MREHAVECWQLEPGCDDISHAGLGVRPSRPHAERKSTRGWTRPEPQEHRRRKKGAEGGNTKSDDLSVKIGYELRQKYGDNSTPENIRQAIVDHSMEYWTIRAANKEDAVVTPPKNNR
jgi:hypothetical protein